MSEGFTIVGAGAVGAIVGVRLALAGHAVRFVEADRAHVAEIRAGGLRLSGHTEAVIRPEVMLPEEAAGPFRQVLLAVKARHTEAALAPVAAALAPDGWVLSLQNGLEEDRIARHVGSARTVGAFLTFGGHYREPGHVVYGGPGTFRIGEIGGRPSPRVAALRDALAAVQPVEATPNIFGFLWAKLALAAIYFATALGDRDVPDLYAGADNRALFGRLAGEVVAVAEATGVALEAFDGFDATVFRPGGGRDADALAAVWEAQLRYWTRHSGRRTGIWRDLAVHRRPTEVDPLVGAVVERAGPAGVAVPLLRRLVALVHDIEAGRRALGPDTLDALRGAD